MTSVMTREQLSLVTEACLRLSVVIRSDVLECLCDVCDRFLNRQSLHRACPIKAVHTPCPADNILCILRFGDWTSVTENDYIRLDTDGCISDLLNELYTIVKAFAACCANAP